ncbi:MAG: hypothetical protein FJ030_18760 [Chloroflexi bacterium]|nr:hypothetical protein [Chloroflexota bacterium]
MKKHLSQYYQPVDLPTAQVLLDRNPRSAVISLGPKPPLDPYAEVEVVIDVGRIDLSYVKEEGGLIRIGSMAPLQTLVESPIVRALADGILSDAAHLSAHLGLRHLATLDGAIGASEGPPEVRAALLALEALPVMHGAILAEVHIAAQPSARGAMARLARSPRDEAIAVACAVVEASDGVCRRARLVAASPAPQRFESAGRMLEGQALKPERLDAIITAVMKEAKPVGDYRGSEEYRRAMIGVLMRRALAEAWRKTG